MKKSTCFVVLILSIVMASCITVPYPGDVSSNFSSFDGVREVSMIPAWAANPNAGKGGSNGVKLALSWRSNMPPNKLVLYAGYTGAHSIPQADSLLFKINGEIVTLSSIDKTTDIQTKPGVYGSSISMPAHNESYKRYLVTRDFVEKLINSEESKVKLLLDKSYVEGDFNVIGGKKSINAKYAFDNFLKEVDKRPAHIKEAK